MRRPNILVIHTDQQRWDTIAAAGNRVIRTPNLDALAARGVCFTNCYAQNPVCMPSRISLMTGRYCSALRITHMAVSVPEDLTAIQHILRRSGYHTAVIGKLHYLPHSNRRHNRLHPAYGFDHVEISDEPGCYEDAYRAWVRRRAPGELDTISVGLPPVTAEWQRLMHVEDDIRHAERMDYRARPFPGRSDVTQAAFVGERTIEYIERRAGASSGAPSAEPFFCFAGFYSPHSPWVAPEEYLSLYNDDEMPLPHYPDGYPAADEERFTEPSLRSITKGYYAMISEVDHWVGRIMDALGRSGRAEDTVVVFTSDHGEWLGEHRRFGKGYWAPDVVSRVPLIVSVPESMGGRSGIVSEEIVECVDVVPTLLSVAGLPVPPDVQGDVLAVANGMQAGPSDGLAITEHAGWKSLRSESYRYVAQADGTEHLYDLEQDPWEYEDRANDGSSASLLAEARKALIKRTLEMEQPLEREWPY